MGHNRTVLYGYALRFMISDFKPLTVGDIETVRPYFGYSKTRACDNSVGAMMMWRDYFKVLYAIIDGVLVFSLDGFGERCCQMPLGKEESRVAAVLKGLLKESGGNLTLCSVAEQDLPVLERYFEVSAQKEEGWSDYLYNAEDLAFFRGRRFNGQRNHINSFVKNNPGYVLKPIDGSVTGDIMRFMDSFENDNRKNSELFDEELVKTREVIGNFDRYGFRGLALYSSGTLTGFSAGEVINDTLFIHIEKARHDVNGAYQMLTSGFVKSCLDDISYVNREEDVGDEGLRRSKLSYHPCAMIDKYTAVLSEKRR